MMVVFQGTQKSLTKIWLIAEWHPLLPPCNLSVASFAAVSREKGPFRLSRKNYLWHPNFRALGGGCMFVLQSPQKSLTKCCTYTCSNYVFGRAEDHIKSCHAMLSPLGYHFFPTLFLWGIGPFFVCQFTLSCPLALSCPNEPTINPN